MSLQAVCLLACLLVTCVILCQGLELTFDRTPGSQYCAQLRCEQVVSQTDQQILFLIGLSVYNLTSENSRVKLSSISAFDPDLYIDQSKVEVINGTGSFTKSQGYLALSFQDVTDCVEGSFLCQLDFVNVSGQPDIITENTSPDKTSPDNSGSDALFVEQLRSLTARVNNLTSNTQTALAALEQENTVLESKVSQLTQNDTVLEGKVTQLTQENVVLEDKLAELTQNGTVLDSKINQLAVENLAFRSSLDKLGQRLDMIESQDPEIACAKNKTKTEFLLWGYKPALCDTQTDSGGWVVIQRRTTGDVDFNRQWADYKKGFGTTDTDYWIGLDVIRSLTLQGFNELRVDLNFEESTENWFAHYSNFAIASESQYYQLSVSGYSGSAGDGFQLQRNMYFSTKDRDYDGASGNCGVTAQGGWWYSDQGCWFSSLNAPWGLESGGVSWSAVNASTAARLTEMKLRRP